MGGVNKDKVRVRVRVRTRRSERCVLDSLQTTNYRHKKSS